MITTKLKPKDLTTDGLNGNGWRMETNASAYFLILMAQKHGSWRDFTQKEIDKVAKHDFHFNDLINYNDNDYIQRNIKLKIVKSTPYTKRSGVFTERVEEETVSYSFTDSFILQCKVWNDNFKNKN